MKKDSRTRLFEVMGRLDKTFKPKLNEGFEEIEATDDVEVPAEMGVEEPEEKELSPEEKLAELTAKVDELYALLHGESEEETPVEEPEEIDMENGGEEEGEVEIDNLEENLNEHHLNDKASRISFICKNNKNEKKEDLEKLSDEEIEKKYLALEKKMGIEEGKEKIPVAAVAKVGK